MWNLRLLIICIIIFTFSLALKYQLNNSCKTIQNVVEKYVIVVPFRNRTKHAKLFLKHMIQFLDSNTNNSEFNVLIVQQADRKLFNRGFLFNVGLSYIVEKRTKLSCVIFHDVDLLPISSTVPYLNCIYPIQLSSELEHWNWAVPGETYCGGVVSMKLNHWLEVNGFSNRYHGWGGEDDDLFERLKRVGLLRGHANRTIVRPKIGNGKFKNTERFEDIPTDNQKKKNHEHYNENYELYQRMRSGKVVEWRKDGIRNMSYRILHQAELRINASALQSLTILNVINLRND